MTKILFIGNSHTYFNDMPHLLEMFYEQRGKKMEAFMLAHSGMSFEWHMEQYYEIRYNLLYGHFDYCIMQQAAHPFPGLETTIENGERLCGLCKSGGTAPVFALTWAQKAKPENQKKMNEAYEALCAKTGALLSPVGYVWERVRAKYPEIELFYKDGEHASPYGDYLIACCHYRLLTGEAATGLSNAGIDFLKAAAGERACENKAAAKTVLDMEKCRQIQETVEAYFNKNQF